MEELRKRFLQKNIKDFLTDNLRPFPAIICEMQRIYIVELVRKFCWFSEKMVPFTCKHFQPIINEGLEIQRGRVDYGDLYILVSVN
jgi:hypothetical protein